MHYAVDHIYFSGCLDSSGHEKVSSYRYRYEDMSTAKARVRSCLTGFLNTSTVRLLRFSSKKGNYEVIGVFSPGIPFDDVLDRIDEGASSDRHEVIQSDLNYFI